LTTKRGDKVRKNTKQTDGGKFFVLPEHLVLAKVGDRKLARIAVRKTEAKAGELTFDAYLVRKSGKRGGLKATLAVLGISPKRVRKERCTVGGREHELVTVPGRVRIHAPADETEKNKMHQALAAYSRELERFSRFLGGVELHFHSAKLTCRDSFPNEPGRYRIFTNSSPAGEVARTFGSTIFGMPLDKDGYPVGILKPTPGRGISLMDQDEHPCVQVIGNKIYFLVPTVDNYRGELSRIIFRKLFISGWDGIRSLAAEKKTKPLSRRGRAKVIDHWVDCYAEGFRKEVASLDEKAAIAMKELAAYMRSKQEFAMVLAFLNAPGYARRAKKRLADDLDALRSSPDFQGLFVVDEGLHLATKRIIIEHGGRNYDLGFFTIRIGRNGRVSVWNDQPTHPGRLSHPHVNEDGSPCFGNATEAIIKAAAEFRYYDAACMTLRWLKDGYTPELAAVKIEEWPLVKERSGENARS
jgi:hypothetical protein